MPMGSIETIPARRGKAAFMRKGQAVKVINTHGHQVVDTWAFNANDPSEYMSMQHSHVAIDRVTPKVGDSMVTNRRRPILTFLEDTTPGVHDTLIAACDRYRFELLGCPGHHDNCTDNMWAATAALGVKPPDCPPPLNLFMNTPFTPGKGFAWLPPVSKPGDHVLLRAEMDLVICLSACPQDVMPINDKRPTEAQFEII